jgi:hypothetical protein
MGDGPQHRAGREERPASARDAGTAGLRTGSVAGRKLLGTALAFVSIVLAIASARGLAAVLSGAWAWFGAAFGASLVFALIESVEFMFAKWLQERRGESVAPDQ